MKLDYMLEKLAHNRIPYGELGIFVYLRYYASLEGNPLHISKSRLSALSNSSYLKLQNTSLPMLADKFKVIEIQEETVRGMLIYVKTAEEWEPPRGLRVNKT